MLLLIGAAHSTESDGPSLLPPSLLSSALQTHGNHEYLSTDGVQCNQLELLGIEVHLCAS